MAKNTRWMLHLKCEVCGGDLQRSIQDIVKLLKGDTKEADKACPHCGASITYETGLTPQDLEEEAP